MKKHILLFSAACFLVIANIFVWVSVFEIKEPPRLEVTFLDVGQGDAILIETPNGNQMLIDGGRDKKVLRGLGNEMSFFDRHIDVVLATHPDADHLGGLLSVVERYDSGLAFVSGAPADGKLDENFSKQLAQKGIQKVKAKSGTVIDFGGGVIFEILSPYAKETSQMESNASSVVGKLTYGKTSFLLTGDAPSDVEKYLAFTYSEKLHADVLKAGHHGSDTSTSDVFLSAVDPEATVISVGAENSYGHPSKEVVDRVRESGSDVFMTSKRGALTFRSDGRVVEFVE